MKVGLDALTLSALRLDALSLLDKVVEYRLEGVQYFSHELMKGDAELRRRFADKAVEHDLYLELTGGGVNPGSSGRTVEQMVEGWKPLFPLANEVGATILNTCFGMHEDRMCPREQFLAKVATTTEVLRRVAELAAAHNVIVTMELHTDLLSKELAAIIAAVNSPFVRVNLDTANSLALLEDPVEAATNLLPYVVTTHYKDSCVYLTENGFNWQGGAPLGTGLVDLPTVTEMLYQAQPGIHLNIEDSYGFIPIELYDPAFINSFPEMTPLDVVSFLKFLRKGESLVTAGVHPRPENVKSADLKVVMPSRLWHNTDYARRLRDALVAKYGKAG